MRISYEDLNTTSTVNPKGGKSDEGDHERSGGWCGQIVFQRLCLLHRITQEKEDLFYHHSTPEGRESQLPRDSLVLWLLAKL
jgi:hypothetical protein